MANSIRNILTIYGPLDEADRFTGRFLRGGMEAFIPIPPEASSTDTWGACQEGLDVEVMTADSIAAVEFRGGETRPHFQPDILTRHWLNYNNFSIAAHQDEIRSYGLQGFLGQDMTPVAVIVFCTKWKFPARWIEHLINAEYERGLIMHMSSYDLTNYEVDGYYHSYTSQGPDHIQSGHCAICIAL